MATPKYWQGQLDANCDICRKPLTNAFIDGRTNMGPWANMCPTCFKRIGTGLGTGMGQRYERQEDGRWLKTGG